LRQNSNCDILGFLGSILKFDSGGRIETAVCLDFWVAYTKFTVEDEFKLGYTWIFGYVAYTMFTVEEE